MNSFLCSDRLHHAAFGYHQRTVEGIFCTVCRVLSPTTSHGEPEAGTEANKPSGESILDSPSTAGVVLDAADEQMAEARDENLDGGRLPPSRTRGHVRLCSHCGKQYRTVWSNKTYCGSKCRKAAYAMRRYIREKAMRGERYRPRFRRPALTSAIDSKPYRIPEEEVDR